MNRKINNIYLLPHILLFALLLASTACGNEAKQVQEKKVINEGDAQLVFENKEYDLGKISEGEQVIAWFDYTNKGEGNLVIQNIKAGCGCTVPDWNRSPLAPGEEASIKVVFNSSGKRGIQNIPIKVSSNALNPNEDLKLKAIVE